MSVAKKVAVVTGGASGIGAACCRFLAQDGMDIAIWDMNAEAMNAVAEEIRGMDRKVVCSVVNVADRNSVKAAADEARAKLGAVTVLVNSAGVHATGAFTSLSDDDWNRVININLNGTFICCQELVTDMIDANWGRIINISSSSTQTGSPKMAHYIASKSGVIGLTKALAVELGEHGITVNNVPPGSVDTPMLRDLESRGGLPGGVEAIAARNPVKRIGVPDDMAAAVAFLASDNAGYITGHTLSVNGGRYMC